MALTQNVREAFKSRFTAMEPLPRTWALVGFYMMQFAMLENEVDVALDAVMKLKPISMNVLSRHLDMSAKVQILRTFTHMVYAKSLGDIINSAALEPEGKAVDSALKSIADPHLKYRNMVAHSIFNPDTEGDGVLFATVKASSRLLIKNVPWTTDDFFDRAIEMQDLRSSLTRLQLDAKRGPLHEFLDTAVSGSLGETLDTEE